MTKIKFSTSQFLAALALAAAIGLMIQAININPASALEVPETSEATDASSVEVSNATQLKEAFANKDVTTVTVLESFEVEAENSIMIIDHDMTIDLNEKTITNKQANAILFRVNSGNVTIKNGYLAALGNGGSAIRIRGSQDDKENVAVVTVEQDVTINVAPGDEYAYGVFVDCYPTSGSTCNAYGVKLNFKGKIYGGEGVYVHGYVKGAGANAPQININGATIDVDDLGIYAAGYAKWTVSNTTIIAGNATAAASRATDMNGTGVGIKSGSLAFNNDTITAHGTGRDSAEASGSIQGNGSVFQIENRNGYGTGQDIELTINGGTYTSDDNAVFVQYGSGDQSLKSINITGGTFEAATGKKVFDIPTVSDDLVSVSGGTFSSDVTKYIAEGKELIKNADGSYTIGNIAVGPSTPSTDPSEPGDETKNDPAVTIPNTGALNYNAAVNAIASVSLVVSLFVAGGIVYNRYKVYHRVKAYVPNPSVDRIRRK